jgi:hypothetical protein
MPDRQWSQDQYDVSYLVEDRSSPTQRTHSLRDRGSEGNNGYVMNNSFYL